MLPLYYNILIYGLIMKHKIIFLLGTLFLFISTLSFACDDKSCEVAYLNSTSQYIDLNNNHAHAAQRERVAYAKVRENRQKKLNEQLVREARYSLVRIITQSISKGDSMETIAKKVDAAYESGAIKAKVISLDPFREHKLKQKQEFESVLWSFLNRVLRLD